MMEKLALAEKEEKEKEEEVEVQPANTSRANGKVLMREISYTFHIIVSAITVVHMKKALLICLSHPKE